MAVVALRRVFSLAFSGGGVGTLYPLAGWQPRRAAGRRFLFDGMTAALAAASARYGVSVAERLATDGRGGSAACFLSGFSGWRVGTLYPLAGWQPRRAAGRRFLFDGMTAALAAASARYGVSVAERLATDGRGGSAACFLSGFSGWRVGTLYPLAGWQPRRAAGRRFLFDGMTAALAAASARYGVSVAERLATDGRGGSAACFLSGFSGWRVGTLYPLAGWQPRRAAGRRFLFDGMTAALAAASARYGVSVAERLATDGRGGSAACFLSGFSGWRVGTLYPLAGWQPRRAAGRRFLFDGMTAALAAASARYGVSVAERLATDGRGGSAACFLSGFSGWRVGTLYPLAGWQPRRAAGRRFLFDGMTAALAAASARYGVSVAERLATDGRGGSAACFLSGFSGWRVGTLYPLAGWQPRRAAGRRFLFDGMTAALAAASARYGVSVAERLATDGRGGSAACFLSGFSGWRVGTLYPLAGWQPRRAAGRRFLFDGMTAALAAASARYGVSVAERLATDGRGGSAACFLSGFSGWRVGTLYPLAGWQPRRAAGRRFSNSRKTRRVVKSTASTRACLDEPDFQKNVYASAIGLFKDSICLCNQGIR